MERHIDRGSPTLWGARELLGERKSLKTLDVHWMRAETAQTVTKETVPASVRLVVMYDLAGVECIPQRVFANPESVFSAAALRRGSKAEKASRTRTSSWRDKCASGGGESGT